MERTSNLGFKYSVVCPFMFCVYTYMGYGICAQGSAGKCTWARAHTHTRVYKAGYSGYPTLSLPIPFS